MNQSIKHTETKKAHVFEFNGLESYKEHVKNYSFVNEENKTVQGYTKDKKKFTLQKHGSTSKSEIENVQSYIKPELLNKLREQVKDSVKMIAIQDVRNKVTFSECGEFVADRYFAGDTKRPFANRSKKRAHQPVTNVYLSNGYSWDVNADNALYNGLAGVVFCEMLTNAGYFVNVKIVTSSDHRDHTVLSVTDAKTTHQYMDADAIATLASDPRFFRFWGFLGIPMTSDMIGKVSNDGLGMPIPISKQKSILQEAGHQVDYIFGDITSYSKAVSQLTTALQDLQSKE